MYLLKYLNGQVFKKMNRCVYIVYLSHKNKIQNVDKPISTWIFIFEFCIILYNLLCKTKKYIDNRTRENILKLIALQTFRMIPKNHLFCASLIVIQLAIIVDDFGCPPKPFPTPSSSSLLIEFWFYSGTCFSLSDSELDPDRSYSIWCTLLFPLPVIDLSKSVL